MRFPFGPDTRIHPLPGLRGALGILSLAFLVLFLAPRESRAGSAGEDRLRQALEQTLRDLETERKALAAEAERQEATEAELRNRIQALGVSCRSLESRIEQTESDLRKVREQRASAEDEKNELLGSETDLRKWILDRVRALASKIELGVPHATRAARLAALRRLETSALSPDTDLSALLSDYMSASIDEVLLGEESETWASVVLTASGRSDEADCVRFGKIFGAYKTRDGLHSAVLLPGIGELGGYEWRESVEAGSIVDKIKGGGRGVELIPLDVSLEIASDRFEIRKDALTTIISGGLVMIPLGLVALVAVVLILERTVTLALARARQARIEESVLAPLRSGDFDSALAAVGEIPGPAALVVRAGLSARDRGKEAVEEAIEEAAVRALPRLERFLSAIAALAAVAPLLGLLGTVTGMISTFDVITLFGTGDPRLMSGGISEALVTTQVGLIIAIPLLLVHRVLSGAVERRITAMETLGVSLVNVLFHLESPPPAEGPGSGDA